VKYKRNSYLDLTVLELLFSPDAVIPQSTGDDLVASNSSGGLGKSLSVPSAF